MTTKSVVGATTPQKVGDTFNLLLLNFLPKFNRKKSRFAYIIMHKSIDWWCFS